MSDLMELKFKENEAAKSAAAIYDTPVERKEVYLKYLAVSALKEASPCIDMSNSLMLSSQLYSITGVFDFYVNNNPFDLILLKPNSDELIFSIKQDEIRLNIYGYVVARLNPDFDGVEVLGYFLSKDLENTVFNDEYTGFELKNISEFENMEILDSQMTLDDVSDSFFELVSKFYDEDITQENLAELTCLLYNSSELRDVFSELGRFDSICRGLQFNKDLIKDDFLNIIAADGAEHSDDDTGLESDLMLLESLNSDESDVPEDIVEDLSNEAEIDLEELSLDEDILADNDEPSTFESEPEPPTEEAEDEIPEAVETLAEVEENSDKEEIFELEELSTEDEDTPEDMEVLIDAETEPELADETAQDEKQEDVEALSEAVEVIDEEEKFDLEELTEEEETYQPVTDEAETVLASDDEAQEEIPELSLEENALKIEASEDISEEPEILTENNDDDESSPAEDDVLSESTDLDEISEFDNLEIEALDELPELEISDVENTTSSLETELANLHKDEPVEAEPEQIEPALETADTENEPELYIDEELKNILETQPEQDELVIDDNEIMSIIGADSPSDVNIEPEQDNPEPVTALDEEDAEISDERRIAELDALVEEENVEQGGDLKVLYSDENTTTAGVFAESEIIGNEPDNKSLKKNKKVLILASILATVTVVSLAVSRFGGDKEAANVKEEQSIEQQSPSLPDNLPNETGMPAEMPTADSVALPAPDDTKIVSSLNKDIKAGAAPVMLKSVAWQVPASISNDTVFNKYLQIAGKNIKMNLASDLLNTSDFAYNNKIKVSMTVKNNAPVRSIKITESSGSKDVDDIVLQSIKQTLKYINSPVMAADRGNIEVVLVISI